MLTMLIAYDAAGNVVQTLDYMAACDADGNVTGLYDFAAHEAADGKLRDFWNVPDAIGSATWPEWLGGHAHDFTVELTPDKRIRALVHRSSHRRERQTVDDAIAARVAAANGEPADLRDLVGGPDRPLILDDEGRTLPRRSRSLRDVLPLVATRIFGEEAKGGG